MENQLRERVNIKDTYGKQEDNDKNEFSEPPKRRLSHFGSSERREKLLIGMKTVHETAKTRLGTLSPMSFFIGVSIFIFSAFLIGNISMYIFFIIMLTPIININFRKIPRVLLDLASF